MTTVRALSKEQNTMRILRNHKVPFKGMIALYDGEYTLKVLSPCVTKDALMDYDENVYQLLNAPSVHVVVFPHTADGIKAFKDTTVVSADLDSWSL